MGDQSVTGRQFSDDKLVNYGVWGFIAGLMDYFIRQQFAPTASVSEADSTMSDSSMTSSDGGAAAAPAPASTDMEMMTATDTRSGMKEEPTKKNRNQKKQKKNKKNKGKKSSKKNVEKKEVVEDDESATEKKRSCHNKKNEPLAMNTSNL